MRNLWRGAALAALTSAAFGTLAACTTPTPEYPVRDGGAPGDGALHVAQPRYPIADATGAQPAATSPAATPASYIEPDRAAGPTSAPRTPAPPPPVIESQALPPPAPAAELANSAASPAAAAAPDASTGPTTTAPGSAALPNGGAAQPTSPPPPAPAPAAVAEPALSPRQVIHDLSSTSQPATPAPSAAPAYRAGPAQSDAERRPVVSGPHYAVAGQVIDAPDDIFQNYEVQKGDHIDALARAFSTTRSVLLDANDRLKPPYLLRPGQILKVPVAKAYVAQSGDTLATVAKRFSVPPDELAQLNHISERAALKPGQRVGLPSSMRDHGPLRVSGGESEYATATPSRPPQHGYQPETTPLPSHITAIPSGTSLTQDRGSTYHTQQPPAVTAQAATGLSDAQISQAAHGRFVWPVRGDIVTRFGPQGVGRRSDGVDIKAAQGTPVRAAAPGEVVYAGDQVPGYGNLVLIKHADGWVTAYAHLDSVAVHMKDTVTQGQNVGSVGISGGVTDPQLHFEVRYAPTPADKARPVDPVLVLPVG